MRRVAGWAVFVAALVGLGALIQAGASPTPRWLVRLPGASHLRLTERHLLTMPYAERPEEMRGPLRAFDAATGVEAWSSWADSPTSWFNFSPGGSWAGAIVGPNSAPALRLVETATGRERDFALEPGDYTLSFAPGDRVAIVSRFDRREKGANVQLMPTDLETGERLATLAADANDHLKFAADGDLLLYNAAGGGVAVWDVVRRQRGGLLECTETPFEASADGRVAVTSVESGFAVWDLADPAKPARVGTIEAERSTAASLTADGRLAVFAPRGRRKGQPLQFWDVAERRTVWRFPLARGFGNGGPTASPDRRFFAAYEDGFFGELFVLDVEARRLAWQKTGVTLTFSPDSGAALLTNADARSVEVRDLATGDLRAELPVPYARVYEPTFEARGRQLWLFGQGRGELPPPSGWWEGWLRWARPPAAESKASFLQCREWPSLRPLLTLRDLGVGEHLVASDGSFVVTDRDAGDHRRIERWDVPPPKPWAWAVGVPVALGAALLGLARWRGRRGRSKAPPPRAD